MSSPWLEASYFYFLSSKRNNITLFVFHKLKETNAFEHGMRLEERGIGNELSPPRGFHGQIPYPKSKGCIDKKR
jgi:hypothetical protein